MLITYSYAAQRMGVFTPFGEVWFSCPQIVWDVYSLKRKAEARNWFIDSISSGRAALAGEKE